MAAADALIFPRPNSAFRFYFPINQSDGTLVTAAWTGIVLTISIDGAATVTNVGTVTQITGLGMGYVEFTALEIGTSKNISGVVSVTNTGALPMAFSFPVVDDGEFPVVVNASGITIIAPVDAVTGDVSVIRGDSYAAAESRRLEWSSADWTPFDLSTATLIQFRAKSRYDDTVFTKTATAASDTLVQCALTTAETDTFPVGRDALRYDLQATLLSGSIVTLAQGQVNVSADIR